MGSSHNKEFELKFKEEITVNPSQNKDFNYYHKMLKAAFEQIYQVLNQEKYLTVTFHSTDIKVWNSIIKAVILLDLILKKLFINHQLEHQQKDYCSHMVVL